jgi:arylsulfatase A-like enzyme
MLYDPGVETALIMDYPNRWDGGEVHDELLSNVDFHPTVLDLIGEPIPDDVDGRSFLPLLDGEKYEPRNQVFLEVMWHDRYNPIRAVRTSEHKYIRNFSALPEAYLPADVINTRTGEALAREFLSPTRPIEELYHLPTDPWEQENLAGERDCSDIEANLRNRLREWMKRTDDPLLDGPVPPANERAYQFGSREGS